MRDTGMPSSLQRPPPRLPHLPLLSASYYFSDVRKMACSRSNSVFSSTSFRIVFQQPWPGCPPSGAQLLCLVFFDLALDSLNILDNFFFSAQSPSSFPLFPELLQSLSILLRLSCVFYPIHS